jgi:hypothetical protein
MKLLRPWRRWRVRRETVILQEALRGAADNVEPNTTFLAFLSRGIESLHGQISPDPPNLLDWTQILVPPEAYYCLGVVYAPGDCAVAVLGDRYGRYSHMMVDLTTGTGHIECWMGKTAARDLFGSFTSFHEAFDGSAQG